jgi:hypothetical protein
MSQLEDLEAIKRLKYQYQRYLDCKLWDELRTVFTEDATVGYDSGRLSASGPDRILELLRGTLVRTDVVSLHQVHCPEIDITSATTARGTWYLHDFVVNPGEESGGMPGHSILQGAGFYEDRYIKMKGQWKIQHTGYERTFELILPLESGPGVALRSRWNP